MQRRHPGRDHRPRHDDLAARWGFLAGFGVLYAVLAGLAELGAAGWRGVGVLGAVVGTAAVVDALHGRGGTLGSLGRPDLRSLVVALVLAGLMQSVYPLVAALTGTSFGLKPGWPVLLVGLFAFHGLAEELVWRGYAFRRLRQGRSFRSAVLLSMPLIAATHLPVIATSGLVVGVAAMLVAAVTSLPLARLFELGGNTLWAAAIVHAGIDSFKVVEVPDDARLTFSLALSAVSLIVPLLVLIPHHIHPAHQEKK